MGKTMTVKYKDVSEPQEPIRVKVKSISEPQEPILVKAIVTSEPQASRSIGAWPTKQATGKTAKISTADQIKVIDAQIRDLETAMGKAQSAKDRQAFKQMIKRRQKRIEELAK